MSNENLQVVATAIKEINQIENLLKRELRKEFYPKITPAFQIVIDHLEAIKKLYSEILKKLERAKGAYPKQFKKNVEEKIQAAQRAYIGIDKALETVTGIRDALAFAPCEFFEPERSKTNG